MCMCIEKYLEEYNYYYNYVLFFKLKQLKEVLYDGLEKMPRKDGKTHHLIIYYMLIVKPNITYLHSFNNTLSNFFCYEWRKGSLLMHINQNTYMYMHSCLLEEPAL